MGKREQGEKNTEVETTQEGPPPHSNLGWKELHPSSAAPEGAVSYRPIWREQELGVRRSSWELPGGKMRRMHVASPVRQVASPVGPGCVKRGGPSASTESALRTGLGGAPAHKTAEKTAYRREQDFQGSVFPEASKTRF